MAEPLKNIYFTETTINKFADEIAKIYPQFDKTLFLNKVYINEWDEKVNKVACLAVHLGDVRLIDNLNFD